MTLATINFSHTAFAEKALNVRETAHVSGCALILTETHTHTHTHTQLRTHAGDTIIYYTCLGYFDQEDTCAKATLSFFQDAGDGINIERCGWYEKH